MPLKPVMDGEKYLSEEAALDLFKKNEGSKYQ